MPVIAIGSSGVNSDWIKYVRDGQARADDLAAHDYARVALKHLPGRHDQKRHAPHSVGGSLQQRLEYAKPAMAKAAQEVYDAWEQDEEGIDPMIGSGGICDQVSESLQDIVLSNVESDVDFVEGGHPGDEHAWFIAVDHNAGQAFAVDIPPGVYEVGGGYSWRKIPGVEFSPDDVDIWEVDYEFVSEDYNV